MLLVLVTLFLTIQESVIGQTPKYWWTFSKKTTTNGATFLDSTGTATLSVTGDSIRSIHGVRNANDSAVVFPRVLGSGGDSRCSNTVCNTDYLLSSLSVSAFTDFPVSISAWIKTQRVGGGTNDGSVICFGASTTTDASALGLFITSAGKVKAYYRNGSNTRDLTGNKVINDGRWHHVVVIFEKGTSGTENRRKIYIDNVLDVNGTNGNSYQAMVSSLKYVEVGGQMYYHRTFYDGAVDEIKVFSTALDLSAINQLYQEGTEVLPPKAPTQFTGTAGTGTIQLKWKASVDPNTIGYKIYQESNPNPVTVASPDTSTLITGLNSGHYKFNISAYNSNLMLSDTIGKGITVYVSRDMIAPETPCLLKIIGRASDAIIFFPVNNEFDLKGYYVYRNGLKVKAAAGLDSIFTKTYLLFAGAVLDTFEVSALDTSGNESLKSNTVFLAGVRDYHIAPYWNGTDNFVFSSTPSNGYKLSWAPARDTTIASSYMIYQDGGTIPIYTKDLSNAEILTLPNTTSFTYTLSGLTPGQTYMFSLKAKDDNGNISAPLTLTVIVPSLIVQNVIFPSDAGVLNVLNYGAKGDGVTDDTKVIQKALNAYESGNRIIYLPNGTYLVSNTLRWPPSSASVSCGTCWKRTVMMGQCRDGVVIKLKNNCSGYQGATDAMRKGVIWTGIEPAQRFRNGVRNLTIDVGTGNQGAAGLQLNTSNQGYSERIKIISEDGLGHSGLDLAYAGEIGPGYANDIFIDGFKYGFFSNPYNSFTLENITVQHQTIYGVYSYDRTLSIRNLTSHNSVTAVKNGTNGNLSVINGTFDGGTAVPAISSSGSLYVRNITTLGYSMAIDNTGGNNSDVVGANVTEFCSYNISSLFTSPQTMLNLPAGDMPAIAWGDTTTWVSPLAYGAIADGSTDNTQAIQDAIDNTNGKTTVYFPAGKTFVINGTLYIRGAVRTLIGCSARITGSGKIVFQNGAEPVVVMHDFDATYSGLTLSFEATRTLRLSSNIGLTINSSNTGNLYLTDVSPGLVRFNQPGQKIWIRQFNPENGDSVNIVNNGATLWLLGLKTERGHTKLLTKNGGQSEIIGIHNYSTSTTNKDKPFFVCDNASLSYACYNETSNSGSPYQYNTSVRRGETTLTLAGLSIPMFVSSYSVTGISISPVIYPFILKVFPNPSNGSFTLLFKATNAGWAKISISNSSGIQAFVQTFSVLKGVNTIPLVIDNLASGVYMIKIIVDGEAVTTKLLIDK